MCEPSGFCSFPDTTCADGRRFDPNAGDGLGGSCVVGAPMPDAGACGGAGQACCASETTRACATNTYCTAGTCQACVGDITFGRHHTCVVKHDHTVWCVGDNAHGQLGFGLVGSSMLTWVQARDATTGIAISDATKVAAGGGHVCALRAGGSVWCWGQNNNGQIGNNSTGDAPAAVPVTMTNNMPLTGIVEIQAADLDTCAIDNAMRVWCWGRNTEGNIGDGTMVERHQAVQVLVAPAGAPLADVVELTLGNKQACIRKTTNEIWCWGNNNNSQLGDGMVMPRPSPVLIGMGTSVSTGTGPHTCFVKLDGTATCVGNKWKGRLGNGDSSYDRGSIVMTPVQVLVARDGPPLTRIAKISVGGNSCALMLDGTVECWGDNTHGQMGTGVASSVAMQVARADHTPLTDVDRVIAHYAHFCAHRSNGELLCWGRGLDGELGDGTMMEHPLPTPLAFACP